MKRISLLIMVFLIVACKGDDDSSIQKTISVEGNWSVKSINITQGKATVNVLEKILQVTFSSTGKNYDIELNLNADKTFESGCQDPENDCPGSKGIYTGIFTYILEGQTFTKEQEVDYFSGTGSWNVTNDVLTLTSTETETAPQIVEIISLTENRMEITYPIDGTTFDLAGLSNNIGELIDFGSITNLSGTATVIFEK